MPTLTAISGALGKKRAAHLLRRATFGPTKAQIEEFAALDISQALDKLLTDQPTPEPPIDTKTGKNWLPKPAEAVNSEDQALFGMFKGWFLDQMRNSGATLKERMTFFYHTHLPIDYTLVPNATAVYYQIALYRYYALGNFKTMFTKVTADNAMLVYIDNTLNDVDSPNENYAREMLELYSIGKGPQIGPDDYTNYTELDVQQAAKVLTGLKHNYDFDTLDPDTSIPRGQFVVDANKAATRHDAGTKTFSAKFGQASIAPKAEYMSGNYATDEGAWDEINQMMDMIFTQDETARFICRKLYRFFVYYKITDEIETDIIEPLAATFRESNYEIAPVLRQLLASQHFYDEDADSATKGAIGTLIKSPIELTLGIFRAFNIDLPTDEAKRYTDAYPSLLESLDYQGIDFFRPIDVAGYPPYHQVPAYNRNWISPNSLARRYELSFTLIAGQKDESEQFVYKLDAVKVANDLLTNPSDSTAVVTELTELLFTRDLTQERFDYFLNTLFLDTLQAQHWTEEWTKYNTSGDDTVVRARLEALINGLIQSPEFQLF